MDWGAIASVLSERSDRAIALLDRDGRTRMMNAVMEKTLGYSRFSIEGKPWADACVPAEHRDETRRWISEAFRGALRYYNAIGLTSTGQQIAFRFELLVVGRGEEIGLLVTATEPARLLQTVTAKAPLARYERDYDITVGPAVFGELVRVVVAGERVELSDTVSCFAVMHGRTEPCDDCPVLAGVSREWPRVVVRQGEHNDVFEVLTADRTGPALVNIGVRRLAGQILSKIQQAKVDTLAIKAGLSRREREVLSYLLLGRSVDDIGQSMGIAMRTVKFHQANVLEKLGAESRADLMRLVF